ncbi:hypothetical protein OAS86_03915 [Gammaproteobacteria bacterium]|nr:hypothetical protein [Gammaproteobacteria bacterium]
MNLNAPTNLFFFISVALAVVGLLGYFGIIGFGIHSFWMGFAAWVVLTLGCVLKGA